MPYQCSSAHILVHDANDRKDRPNLVRSISSKALTFRATSDSGQPLEITTWCPKHAMAHLQRGLRPCSTSCRPMLRREHRVHLVRSVASSSAPTSPRDFQVSPRTTPCSYARSLILDPHRWAGERSRRAIPLFVPSRTRVHDLSRYALRQNHLTASQSPTARTPRVC